MYRGNVSQNQMNKNKEKNVIGTQANIFVSTEIKTRFQRGRVACKYNSSIANEKKHVSSLKCN
jgi:hypothetical protein